MSAKFQQADDSVLNGSLACSGLYQPPVQGCADVQNPAQAGHSNYPTSDQIAVSIWTDFTHAARSYTALQQHIANVADCACWVEAFRTNRNTVLNSMATEYAEGIIQLAQAMLSRGVAAVCQETVRLQ